MRFWKYHASVVPTFGTSVMGESKCWPSISTSSGSSASLSCSFSVKSFGLPIPSVSTSVGMSMSFAGRACGVHGGRVLHLEPHDLARRAGIDGVAAGERLVRGVLQDDPRSGGHVREVDQDVHPLGGGDERFGQGRRRGQVAAVAADLGEGHAVRQLQVVEARVRRVDDAEAVLAAVHAQARPHLAVHEDGVAEVLGIPVGVDVGVVADLREVDGAVAVERAVLEQERNLERARGEQRGDRIVAGHGRGRCPPGRRRR